METRGGYIEITVEALFDLLQAEKKTNELQQLPENFFSLIEKTQALSSNNDAEQKNIKKLVDTLKSKRIQKILLYLAYNKQLPHPVPDEEKEIYSKIKEIISNTGGEKTIKIKINADVPEIITQTGNKLGPFRQNQIIELSDKNSIDFLLMNKIGEIIS